MAATGKSWLAAAAAPVRTEPKHAHLLHRTFQFSFMKRGHRDESYGSSIRDIASVATVEEFWSVYNHLARVSRLPASTDYFLFQEGVRPMWEDDANKDGGRWTLRLPKSVTAHAFENLCLALIGEQFESDDVCGIACSVRFQDNNLSIWLRNAQDKDTLNSVVSIARRVIDVPPDRLQREWEFKPHH